MPPLYQISYKIKIVELLQGQICSQAKNANFPVYENNQIQINSFTYPIDTLHLEAGKKYAWQLQVLDQYGFPPTTNLDKSEIFTFTVLKANGIKDIESFSIEQSPLQTLTLSSSLKIKAPENDELIKTGQPKFLSEFTGPVVVFSPKYNIRVVNIFPSQSLKIAIHNCPI